MTIGDEEYRARDMRAESEPAFAVTEKARSWIADRPATVVQGDPRIFAPGGHIANDGRDNSKMIGRSDDAIRVTLEDAGVLQGFPPDYPWQGTRSKRFQQVGNAVPPPMARAVIEALTRKDENG